MQNRRVLDVVYFLQLKEVAYAHYECINTNNYFKYFYNSTKYVSSKQGKKICNLFSAFENISKSFFFTNRISSSV
jgi:hypothetical protein